MKTFITVVGAVRFIANPLTGGVPEKRGARLLGSGTGKVPETAQLRDLKVAGGQDQHVVLMRNGKAAVVLPGSTGDQASIRSPGLTLTIRPETLRSEDSALREVLKGATEVHLCRAAECRCEEGLEHFKVYGLAAENMVDFQTEAAKEEMAQVGQSLGSWWKALAGGLACKGRGLRVRAGGERRLPSPPRHVEGGGREGEDGKEGLVEEGD